MFSFHGHIAHRIEKYLCRYVLRGIYVLAAIYYVATPALAQTPANDNCNAARTINITNGGYDIDTFYSDTIAILNATKETGETFHPTQNSGTDKKSIWYAFTLPTARGVSIELFQTANDIAQNGCGITIYKSSTCLPTQADIQPAKLTPIDKFGSTFNPCLFPGDYLVQLSSRADSDGDVFLRLILSNSTILKDYDFKNTAFSFGKINGNTPIYTHEIGCQTVDNGESCAAVGADYTQSTWHTFVTDGHTDYLRFSIRNTNGLSLTYGYRLYAGNALNPAATLTEVDPCKSISQNGTNWANVDYNCDNGILTTNDTFSIQLFYHKDIIAEIETRIYEIGGGPTVGMDPTALPGSHILGALTPSPSGTWYSTSDWMACNADMSNYTCATGIPGSGIYSYNGDDYTLNTWTTFTLNDDANVLFQAPVSCSNKKLLVRLFDGDVTAGSACAGPALSMVTEFLYEKNMICLPGFGGRTYSVQVLGLSGSGELSSCSASSHLGRPTSLRLRVNQVNQFNFFSLTGLDLPTGNANVYEYNEFGGFQFPLPDGTTIFSAFDQFGCANTVLTNDGNKCGSTTKGMYRTLNIGDADGDAVPDSGVITIGGGNWRDIGRYKLYRGNAQSLANAQNKYQAGDVVTGLSDQAACQSTYFSFRVCATPGDYTLLSYGNNNMVGIGDQPWVRFNMLNTTYNDPNNPEDLGDLNAFGSLTGTDDYFSCENNSANVGGLSPCSGTSKLIYRQFEITQTSLIRINRTSGSVGTMRLYSGKISDVGLSGVSLYNDGYWGNWNCFTSRSANSCYPVPPGWYTVVSYGSGGSYSSPTYASGRGGDIGQKNNISITTFSEPNDPKYNRPNLAYDGGTLVWGPNSGTVEIPINSRTYSLATEYFNCTPDTPFTAHPVTSCDPSFNRVAYYRFTTTQTSSLVIDNIPSSMQYKLFSLDTHLPTDAALLPTYTPIQPCIRESGTWSWTQICNLQPGTYTLVIFAGDQHIGGSVRPIITLDSVGISRYDFAADAYDFGDVPGDDVEIKGNLTDTIDIYGRQASNDFFFCTTGAEPEPDNPGPGGSSCWTGSFPTPGQSSVPYPMPPDQPLNPGATSSPNIRRNLWYAFTVTGPGKVYVSVYNRTPGKTIQSHFAIYESDDLAIGDSTLADGLTYVKNNYYWWCGRSQTVNFDINPCGAIITRRYYVVVYNDERSLPNSQVDVSIRFDSIPITPLEYDTYASAYDFGDSLTNGVYLGDTTGALFSCATPSAYDQNSCGSKTLWYRFNVNNTGRARINYDIIGSGTYNSASNIELYYDATPGDPYDMIKVPLTSLNSGGMPWQEGCVTSGTYYIMMTGCSYNLHWVVPRLNIIYESGDFASTAVTINIPGIGAANANVAVDCHTIGEGPGEDTTINQQVGCMFQPKGYKTTWFKVNYSGANKVDLSFQLSENTSAFPFEIRYRVLYGTPGALTPGPCNTDALTEFTLNCMMSGNYFVQVMMPENATGSVQIASTTTLSPDQTCEPIDPEKPITNFNFTGGCVGDPVQFTNLSTVGDSMIYNWDFDDLGATSTAFEPTHTYATADTYNVQLIATNIENNKSDTLTIPLPIYSKPTASIQRLAPNDSIVITSGSTVTFDGNIDDTTVAPGLPVTTYLWEFGDDANSTSTLSSPPPFTYGPLTLGITIVTLTITTGSCSQVFADTFYIDLEDIFGGGPKDGSSEFYSTALCLPEVLDSVYVGGPYDGHHRIETTAACLPEVLDSIYIGGPYDGHHRIETTTACLPEVLDSVYVGGPYDGHHKIETTAACLPEVLDSVYIGGPYDGHHKIETTVACLPEVLDSIYVGGPYDGYSSTSDSVMMDLLAGNDTLCIGDSATLQVTTAGGAPLSILWNTGETTASITVFPTQDTMLTVRVLPSLCAYFPGPPDTSLYRYADFKLHVWDPQAVAGEDQYMCVSDGTDSVLLGGAYDPDYTYRWIPTDSLSDSTSYQPYANPASTTTYYLIVSSTDGVQCASDTDTVTVYIEDPSAISAGADVEVCTQTSTQIGSPALAGFSYSWWPTTYLDNANTAQPMANPPTSRDYFLTVTRPGTVCPTYRDTMRFDVFEAPVANAGSDVFTCVSDGSDPKQLGTVGLGLGYIYRWSPSTALDDSSSPMPFASPSTTTTYQLIVRTPNGTCSPDTDTVAYTVNTVPIADAGADVVSCGVSPTVIGTSAVPGMTYSWFPSSGLNDASLAQPTASPDITKEYIISVVPSSGLCATVLDTMLFTVDQSPTANAGNDTSSCGIDTFTIGTPAVAGNIYAWTPSLGLDDTTKAQPLAYPSVTTTYYLTASFAGTCPIQVDSMVFTVNSFPTVSAGPDVDKCEGSSTTLNAAGAGTYEWFFEGISIGTGASMPVTDTGKYALIGVDANGCSDSDTVWVADYAQSALHYRTKLNGDWTDVSIWEVSVDGIGGWTDAASFGSCGGAPFPSSYSKTILIRDSVYYDSSLVQGVDEGTISATGILYIPEDKTYSMVDSSSSSVAADLDNHGRLNIAGIFQKVGVGLLVNDPASTVAYTGSNVQIMWNGRYGNLEVSHPTPAAALAKFPSGTSTIITTAVYFYGAPIQLNNYKIILDTNASVYPTDINNGYFVTNASGMVQKLSLGDSSSFLFTVGHSWLPSKSYNPIQVTNNGTTDDYSIRVSGVFEFDGVYSDDELIRDCSIDRTWFIEEATPSGSNLDLEVYFEDGHKNANFQVGNASIGEYNAADGWQDLGYIGNATGAGTTPDPYRKTVSGITLPTSYAVGSRMSGDHYRSISDGLWSDLNIWEVANNVSGPWTPAVQVISACGDVAAPSSVSKTVTVRHTVTFDNTLAVGVDETTILQDAIYSGVLLVPDTTELIIVDGAGIDVENQGKLVVTGVLSTSGNATLKNLDTSIVHYNGEDQNMWSGKYGKLWVDGPVPIGARHIKYLTDTSTEVHTEVKFINAKMQLGGYNCLLDSGALVQGADSTTGYMLATGSGGCRWMYASGTNVGHLFPIGGDEYSPAIITFDTVTTGGTLTGRLTETVHPLKTTSIARFWTMTQGSILFNGSYTADVHYQDVDLPQYPINSTAELQMVEVGGMYSLAYGGDGWRLSPSGLSYTVDLNANVGTLTNNAFSDITLLPIDETPLPVSKLLLNGEWKGDNAMLRWQTDGEINSFGYTLERSTDGIRYEAINWTAGMGTANYPTQYSFLDTEISAMLESVYYYRVVQTDLSGKVVLSNVVELVRQSDKTTGLLAVYPNPLRTNQSLTMSYYSEYAEIVQIDLFDAVGKRLYTQTVNLPEGESKTLVQIGNLSDGTYLFKVISKNKTVVRRVIVLK